jgi:hypothetical protein
MPHVLLNGALETQMPSLSNSPRIRSAPQNRFCPAISLIKATVSAGIFGLEDAALDLYFQNRRASLAMPLEQRLWPDNEQGLFPGPNCPRQKNQEHPVCFGTGRSFHLSPEDDKRLSKERVFCHEFGLASGKVCQRP